MVTDELTARDVRKDKEAGTLTPGLLELCETPEWKAKGWTIVRGYSARRINRAKRTVEFAYTDNWGVESQVQRQDGKREFKWVIRPHFDLSNLEQQIRMALDISPPTEDLGVRPGDGYNPDVEDRTQKPGRA